MAGYRTLTRPPPPLHCAERSSQNPGTSCSVTWLDRLRPVWKQTIQNVYPSAEFAGPATVAALDAVQQRLGRLLPAPVRELLLEADGVQGHFSVDTVWSLEQIVQQNLYFRTAPDFAELYIGLTPEL